MGTSPGTIARGIRVPRRLVIAALLGSCGILVAVWAIWPCDTVTPDWSTEYDVAAKTPDQIIPGTTVAQSAPNGWTHLVIKTLPRIRPADRERVLPIVNRYAQWLTTAFVANVQSEKSGLHRIRSVGFGLGPAVNGVDTIITPETAPENGVDLGLIARQLLTKSHELQRQTLMPIHGPTFALVDAPAWYRAGAKNRLIRFRYGLLANSRTGELKAVVWGFDPGGECFSDAIIGRLQPDTIDEAELIHDATEFNLGMPTAAAFGVDRLPSHIEPKPLPKSLQPLALASRFTPTEAHELERGLRNLYP